MMPSIDYVCILARYPSIKVAQPECIICLINFLEEF